MKVYVDDIRPAPDGYVWCKSVNQAIKLLESESVEGLDLDHDLGDFAYDGGDAINILDWCIEHQVFPDVKLHTSNPVGRKNMQRLLDRYW